MPPDESDDFRKQLLCQLSIDFAVLSNLSAEAAKRREEDMRRKRKEWVSPRTMPADAVRVAPTHRRVSVEMLERERFFQKHGLNLRPVTEIRVPRTLSPYEKERARLAMEWYNADTDIARALAARRYLIYTKGWVGLMYVWFNPGAVGTLNTGPTLFNLVERAASTMPVDRTRSYPKMESPF